MWHLRWHAGRKGLAYRLSTSCPAHLKNGRVERKFATLFGKVHAMLKGNRFDKFWCQLVD